MRSRATFLYLMPPSDLADGPKPWSAEEQKVVAILLFIFVSRGDVTCGWVCPSPLAPGRCPEGVPIQCGGEMGEDSSSSRYQDQTRVCKPLQGVGPVCVLCG